MKDKVLKQREIVSYIMTVLAFVLLGYAIVQSVKDFIDEKRAIKVSAKIKGIEYSALNYRADISFKVEDKTYEHYHIPLSKTNKLTVGDTVEIKYDMNNPNVLINNNHLMTTIPAVVFSLIFIIVFLPKTLKLIANKKNIKRLKAEGYIIDASVSNVYVNTNGKKHKEAFPYRLRSTFLNPSDQKEYIFESADSYVNLSDVINFNGTRTVKVYIDKNNTTNYYVDLDSLIAPVTIIDPSTLMADFKAVKDKPIDLSSKEE